MPRMRTERDVIAGTAPEGRKESAPSGRGHAWIGDVLDA
jgi:hypothetical protein